MMTKAFITGISGFVGSHLAEWLLGQGCRVSGLVHPETNLENLEGFQDRLDLHRGDLLDPKALRGILAVTQPDRAYHLAGLSHVQDSWRTRQRTYEVNFLGTFHLLEAFRDAHLASRILVVGSSQEYGVVPEPAIAITESQPLRPTNPYAVSKVCQEMLAFQYAVSDGMHVVMTRPFNHTGPRQDPGFVCSDFARQIAAIDLGLREPVLCLGSLAPRRDFTDVRDVARAYWLLLERATAGEVYNVCSMRAYAVGEVVEALQQCTSRKVTVQEDPKRVRQEDIPVLLGDNRKLVAQTGWRPEVPFHQSLRDLFIHWQGRLRKHPEKALSIAPGGNPPRMNPIDNSAEIH